MCVYVDLSTINSSFCMCEQAIKLYVGPNERESERLCA